MLRLATDQADISNVVFEQVGSEMDTLAGYAETVRRRPVLLTARPLFSQSERPPNPKNASVYILAPVVTAPSVRDELSTLSQTDDLMQPLLASDIHLTQIYIGTGSGILWVNPWVNSVPSSYDPITRDCTSMHNRMAT